ncbi:MAG: phosphoribosylaminoimidazolesuccinocarboxamide synthase [Candidatus Zixiibacteriota bacterium]
MTPETVTLPGALLETDLGDLKPVSRGKVRDIYDLGEMLLIVATDRISAFDVILPTGIPGKGRVLTQMSQFWFEKTRHIVPNHLITCDVSQYPQPLPQFRDQLAHRSMLVRKCKRIDYECVARGYITGSLFKEYREALKADAGDPVPLHGFTFPRDLVDSQKLPETIFTPATKSESGHDINVSFEHMANDIGTELAERLRDVTIQLYEWCANYAAERGIIIADTKFEFGFNGDELTLIDEICSPDSSRFWPADQYQPGQSQPSYDKQYVRDYLLTVKWDKTPPAPELPADVVRNTVHKYEEAQRRLMA